MKLSKMKKNEMVTKTLEFNQFIKLSIIRDDQPVYL